MKTLSLSEAKAKLSGLVEEVERRDAEVIITRNGRPAAVLVSPDEYESWKETHAIRSDKELLREIRAGLAAIRARKAKLYSLEELFKK
jgi:antitoxin YefM